MALVSGEITFIHLLYIEHNFIYLKKNHDSLVPWNNI